MGIETAPDSAVHRIDNDGSQFCHLICNASDDRALCGLIVPSDDLCTKDPCDNECLVCLDLEIAPGPCPVCGTYCSDES